MNPITAVSFVRNEENNLKECLSLLRPYVDEIIVIDLESVDGSYETAKLFADKVEKRPHLLCGDGYKMTLASMAKNQWILWFYPDERWPEKTMKAMEICIKSEKWTSYCFMRHEYMDNVRVAYEQNGKQIFHGSVESPNFQNRLHRIGKGIFYTELVHAEIHGTYQTCHMPADFFFEHRKTRVNQEFDNWRTVVWMRYLIWKYGNTSLEPYKTYVDSYKQIVAESIAVRPLLPMEERWWNWREEWEKYQIEKGVTE